MIQNGESLEPPVTAPHFIRQLMTEGCWQNAPSARISFDTIYDKLSADECSHSEQPKDDSGVGCDYLHVLPGV